MKQVSFREIAIDQAAKERVLAYRELILAERILRLVEGKLKLALESNSANDSQAKPLKFSVVDKVKSKAGPGIDLTLTIFGFDCSVRLSSILALEIVNQYLDKVPPAIDRELNKEEIAVIALISTLLISELRESGTTGIYLKSASVSSTALEAESHDIVIEEEATKQQATIKLETDLISQLGQRSKLILVGRLFENVIAETSHTVRLHLDAEVKSLSTLFKLRPGVLWKLGERIWPTVMLNEEVMGYGSLIITKKEERRNEAA